MKRGIELQLFPARPWVFGSRGAHSRMRRALKARDLFTVQEASCSPLEWS